MKLKSLLTLLLLCNLYCGKNYVCKPTVLESRVSENTKENLIKKVSVQEIKASSKGILETEIMVGCFAGLIFSMENDKPFVVLSHYPQTQTALHLNALRKEKDFWLKLQEYHKIILVAFMKNSRDKEYIKNFLDFYQGFHELFPDAKIFGCKYNLGEKIKVNVDKGICYVGKYCIDIKKLLHLIKYSN